MNRVLLAIYGAIGGLAPDVLILYSKRFSMPTLSFSPSQYAIATIAYLALAAVVSAIFPYRGQPTGWKAFGVGVALPIVLSGLLSVRRPETIEPRGGSSIPGALIDLMSLL